MTMQSFPTRARILVLTDDADASRVWTHVLTRHDIEAEVVDYSALAANSAHVRRFHEILVDHYGDPTEVLSICRWLRTLSRQPLLLFTYETDERFQLEAYRLGVEECVSKPIGIPLFVAKTRAWLRQAVEHEERNQEIRINGFHLDIETRILGSNDANVRLSNLECRLLALLMANREQVLESTFLTDRVWAMYTSPDPKMLKNLVYRLRYKIRQVANGQEHIESIEGVGYVFHAD